MCSYYGVVLSAGAVDMQNNHPPKITASTESIKNFFNFINTANLLMAFFKRCGFHIDKHKLYSISTFSFKYFYTKKNTHNLQKKISESLNAYLQESYFGGRCEVFANPTVGETIRHYDYIGMYSSCMLEEYPFGPGSFIFNIDDFSKPGFYDISYLSVNFDFPILPHKRNADNSLFFSNGENRGVF